MGRVEKIAAPFFVALPFATTDAKRYSVKSNLSCARYGVLAPIEIR